MSDRIDLSELLRDSAEIRDLLTAYGEVPPKDEKAARERLIEITTHLGEAHLINTLFLFARGFARMLDDVLSFCGEKGVRILGQIQVKGDEVLAQLTPLQTAWARGGKQLRSDDLENRAHALASELSGLTASLVPDAFIRRESRTIETDVGRAWQHSSDPKESVLYDAQTEGLTHEREDYDAFSKGDLIALKAAHAAILETQGTANHALDEGVRLLQFVDQRRDGKPLPFVRFSAN